MLNSKDSPNKVLVYLYNVFQIKMTGVGECICYGLMFVHLQYSCVETQPWPPCDGIRWWALWKAIKMQLDHEKRALIQTGLVLLHESWESLLLLPALCHVKMQKKPAAVCNPEDGPH